MWSLPTHVNTLIQYKTGDGFRTHLPSMLNNNYHLYVGTRASINMIDKAIALDDRYVGTRASINAMSDAESNSRVTIHGLKYLNAEGLIRQTSIVLDIKIPRVGSMAFLHLREACRGRSVVILHPPQMDVESINTLLLLLAVTKGRNLSLKKWSLFARQNRRPWRGKR